MNAPPTDPAPPTHDETERSLTPPPDGWPVRVTTRGLHGRGVVTTRAVAEGVTCEVAPLMLVPDTIDLDGFEHVFDVDGVSGIAGGMVSFANHSYAPNCAYSIDVETGLVTLYALHDLAPGTEVLVNYNGDPRCTEPVWFDVG
ncbi:MAG TPA: SET domain-containing protein-lysine N-methyltransferase [Acidimicrobiales bacterium]